MDKKVLVKLQLPGVLHRTDATEVLRAQLKCVESGLRVVEKLFALQGLALDERVLFCDGEAVAQGARSEASFSFHDLEATIHRTFDLIEETKSTYHAAYKSQSALESTQLDRHALAFNKAAFAAQNLGGVFVFAPGTAGQRSYVPVDPSALECPRPLNSRSIRIEGAIITGARAANGTQRQFPFDGTTMIDVLVSLQDKVAEVRVNLPIDEAQGLWRGVTRMSADVVLETGKVPRVVGKPTIVREE